MTAEVSTPTTTAADPPRLRSLVGSPGRLAALGLHAAAAGHLVAALAHLSHGWGVAAFFLVTAAVQVLVSGHLARGAGGLLTAAVLAATLGLVLLYLASRTVALPFGGAHTAFNDRPQDADLLGLSVVAAELLTLATGQALLPPAARRWATDAMCAVGVGLWAAWATGLL